MKIKRGKRDANVIILQKRKGRRYFYTNVDRDLIYDYNNKEVQNINETLD